MAREESDPFRIWGAFKITFQWRPVKVLEGFFQSRENTPKLTAKAPKKSMLSNRNPSFFPFQGVIFRCKLAVRFREGIAPVSGAKTSVPWRPPDRQRCICFNPSMSWGRWQRHHRPLWKRDITRRYRLQITWWFCGVLHVYISFMGGICM